MNRFIIVLFSLFYIINSNGQSLVKAGFIEVSAEVQESPPSITLKWNANYSANYAKIRKKAKEDAAWGAYIDIDKTASTYVDNNVQVGKVYEYNLVRNLTFIGNKDAIQNISVGIALPVIDYRGKIILLVEQSVAAGLKSEIDLLIKDMICDGWQVLRYDVPKTKTAINVKDIIKTAYNADQTNVKAVFLLGHVAVPYSGNTTADGHGDHYGAWVADGYYGDMNGTWTDATVNNVTASDPANWNIPGDGKFDQSNFPSPIELQVGRVDLYNLPGYTGVSETELLRRYLNKDHAFRTREFGTVSRALINDQFYISYGDNYAGGAYASYFTLVGASNITEQYNDGGAANHIFRDNRSIHYLYAHADGPGSNGSAGNAITTSDFTHPSSVFNYVFTGLFGSYHGDWDKSNNIMRAALASKGSILTCAWSGRPYWWYHHMGNGDNIGYSALINQNNKYSMYYSPSWYGASHISLLGDPTLRAHIIAPVQNIKDTVIANHVKLTWSPSIDKVLGYHVYKSNDLKAKFTRLTTNVITDTIYTDPAVVSGNYVYMVKAVKLEINRSGTYYNTSRGVLASNVDSVKDKPIFLHPPKVGLPVRDTTIAENFAFSYSFYNTFTDANIFETPTYSLYKLDKTALPAGWSFNDATLSVAAPKKGIYTFVIKITDSQLFEALDTFTINVGNVPVIGIADNTEDAIVFPNPFENNIHIDLKNTGEKVIFNLYDAAGRLVIQKEFNNSVPVIETNILSKGVYFYTLMTEKGCLFKGKLTKL